MSLQNYWIELDQIVQDVASKGSNTEMQEKRAVEHYIKSLGSSARSSVLQDRTPDGRSSVRIYTWLNTPMGNVALLTGSNISPELHYLIPKAEAGSQTVHLSVKDLVSVDMLFLLHT